MKTADLDAIVAGMSAALHEHATELIAIAVRPYADRLKALEERPMMHGRDGLPGVPGPPGERGEKGLDGAPGKDGRDGTLEQLKVQYDDERTLRLSVKATGAPIEGGVIVLPTVIDRGVYQEGRVYAKGDGVTYSGSFWIAQGETDAKPKETNEASRTWRLAVKQGAPGKPGPAGAKGLDGKDGRPGRDLTQMDAQGQKW